jgi:hypothetical protein
MIKAESEKNKEARPALVFRKTSVIVSGARGTRMN